MTRTGTARRLALVGTIALVIVQLGIISTARRAEATNLTRSVTDDLGPSLSMSQNRPGRVVLRNVLWDSVRVEVRVGESLDCDRNALVGVKTLLRGRAWAVTTDQAVCWRRSLAPNEPRSAWTAWTRRRIPAAQQVRERL